MTDDLMASVQNAMRLAQRYPLPEDMELFGTQEFADAPDLDELAHEVMAFVKAARQLGFDEAA